MSLFIAVFITHHWHTCILSMLLFLMPIVSFAALFFLLSFSISLFYLPPLSAPLRNSIFVLMWGNDMCPSYTLFPYMHLYIVKISAETSKFAVCMSIVLASVPYILSAPSLLHSVLFHTIFC
jgi:hypothetical protein